MPLEWEQVVIDSADPRGLGRWWAQALGWTVRFDGDDEVEVRERPDRLPALCLVPVGDPKTENRLHLDFRPPRDQARAGRMLSSLLAEGLPGA